MRVGDVTLFDLHLPPDQLALRWEQEYERVMEPKYRKGTRRFTRETRALVADAREPPIYLIPRERGGPSYKSVRLEGCEPDDVVYAPISKGYPMQDVSSFTLGPVIGEGLCLVNAAFSKCVCVHHIQGGGQLDLKRKTFWRSARTPTRTVRRVSDTRMVVDGVEVDTHDWLRRNETLWLSEWERWRRCVALASRGSFHWDADETPVAFRLSDGRYVGFAEWKRRCYIGPSYALLPHTEVFQYLREVREVLRRPLGLVHPKARTGQAERPITREYLRELFDSPDVMCC